MRVLGGQEGIWLCLLLCVEICYGFLRFESKYLLDGKIPNTYIPPKWIKQPLDHLNPSDTRTFQMKYFENLQFHREGGPVLLFIGGEGPAAGEWLKGGLMASFAKEVNGAMFMSEHRFYGDSVPNNDMSVQNLAYLSSVQALGDLKNFLKFIKSQNRFRNSKVVVFGGSYPGNLAAWARLKFPDLVDAAWSSSAPVLAKSEFFEYIDVVGDVMKKYGTSDCYRKIVNKFKRYEDLIKTPNGIEQLKREDNICSHVDMRLKDNQNLFFNAKIVQYSFLVQYATPESIRKHCLQNEKKFNETLFGYRIWSEERQCNNYDFKSMISYMKNDKNYRPWIYQTCTEFGYMMTTSSNNHPFTDNVPLEFLTKWCSEMFGPNFDRRRMEEGVKKTNNMYGGLRPKVSRVYFVNGDMDPWHKLSILKDLSHDAPAKIIPRASHCMDITSDDPYDLPEFVEVRNFGKRKLKEWIGH